MSYVERVIRPGETLVHRAPLHWVIYAPGLAFAAASLIVIGYAAVSHRDPSGGWQDVVHFAIMALGGAGLFAAALNLIGAFIRRHSTEVAVTSKRVIYKTGIVRRVTSEISVDKIETVLVEQSILGRVFNFGTIVIRGTGGGLEPVRNIDDPLTFRSKLTAR
jgi:uncharacterized membrane protein YdbT with pleckstrin-like domain